jgi:DNA repair ATPase RecN
MMMKRYDIDLYDDHPRLSDDGEWVDYDDAQQAIDAATAELQEERDQLRRDLDEASAELAELRLTRERLLAKLDPDNKRYRPSLGEWEWAMDEMKAMQKDLDEVIGYAGHSSGCGVYAQGGRCNCGLAALRARVEARKP